MRAAILLVALATAACSVTEPVTVITSQGQTLTGTTTGTIAGGHYEVSGGGLTCTGSYDALTPSPTVSTLIRCSDGRTGIGHLLRDSDVSGSGWATMNDGTRAQIIYGPMAQ